MSEETRPLGDTCGSLQRPATPVQKATLDLIRAKAPAVIARAI